MYATGGFRRFRELIILLKEERLFELENQFSDNFFGVAQPFSELIVRQFIFSTLLRQKFHNEICRWHICQRPISYPLPTQWQDVIEAAGIRINRWSCSALFTAFVFSIFIRNIARDLRFFIRIIFKPFKPLKVQNYIFLSGLINKDNLPRDLPISVGGSQISSTYDICSWLYDRSYTADKFEIVGHDLPELPYKFRSVVVKNIPYPWLLITNSAAKARLFLWWISALGRSSLDLLRGRWVHAIMLSEALYAKATTCVERNQLAKKYYFHFSGSTYRPLWTYMVEKLGSGVAAYFYSTYEQPKVDSFIETQRFEFTQISWSKLLVWTERQKSNILESVCSSTLEVEVCGPIWFSDSTTPVVNITREKSVVVFPVEMYRLAYYRGISTASDWIYPYPDLYASFLSEIQNILEKNDLHMVIKLKRNVDRFARKKRNIRLHEELAKKINVTFVDNTVSAFRLAKYASAIVSMPFTGAALSSVAREIPSIYYDPTERLDRSDPASNGIPLVSGITELEQWCKSL